MDGFATYRAVTPTCDKFLVNAQSGSQTMARISKELTKRCDGKTNLAPRHVIVVRVASFAFRFETQLRPWPQTSGEHWRELRGWDVERWFERLPMYLLEEPKRQKVLKALCRALAETGKL